MIRLSRIIKLPSIWDCQLYMASQYSQPVRGRKMADTTTIHPWTRYVSGSAKLASPSRKKPRVMTTIISGCRKELFNMVNIEQIESILHGQGYDDFKWLAPPESVVSQWVRMKCVFG